MSSAAVFALVLCLCSAVAEGVLAGSGVQARFREFRLPRYSLPYRAWFVVGALYYGMIFTVAYRLFLQPPGSPGRAPGIALLIVMAAGNAAWNYAFFRAKNLLVSFASSLPYSLLVIALLVILAPRDRTAGIILSVYLLYLVYAGAWGYRLWRLNPPSGRLQ